VLHGSLGWLNLASPMLLRRRATWVTLLEAKTRVILNFNENYCLKNNNGAIYIYIYIPLVHHLDLNVESIGEPANRSSHPALSPARACLPCGPRLLHVPAVPFASCPRSIATRPSPTPCALTRFAPAHVAQPFFKILPRAQPFLL
jgi:hypothetical protein